MNKEEYEAMMKKRIEIWKKDSEFQPYIRNYLKENRIMGKGYYLSTSHQFQSRSIRCLYIGNIEKYYEYSHLSATLAYTEIKNFGNKVEQPGKAMRLIFSSGLASRKEKELKKYCEIVKDWELDKWKTYVMKDNFLMGLIMRNLISGKRKGIQKILNLFKKKEDHQGPPFNPSFQAIVRRNKKGFIDSITRFLKYKKRYYIRRREIPIDFHSIYLILLAKHCGLKVDIETDIKEELRCFIPKVCFI